MQTQFISSLREIDGAAWDRLWPEDYPFVRHAFLLALEESGCTSRATGWLPSHCLVRQQNRLVGALPLYLKSHSYGEYVFDWSWANAYRQAGLVYYPKLLNAIPFTPASGPRWAADPDLDEAEQWQIVAHLWQSALGLVKQLDASGLHCLFPAVDPRLGDPLPQGAGQWLLRLDCQYHWFNSGYDSFTEFLESFSSRKRKNVLKERSRIAEQELTVEMVEGRHLQAEDWQHFYELYRQTYLKRSGHDGYLNSAFFLQIGARLPDNIVLARAHHRGRWVAGALYFKGGTTLYGRYWGALEDFDGLHFECCYYLGIDYAIRHGLQRFDPGAQGEHKIARGFTPVLTQSRHWLQHPQFAAAIGRYLQEERGEIKGYCAAARAQLPFKEAVALVPSHCLIASAVTPPASASGE